jgi:hypothetical protein
MVQKKVQRKTPEDPKHLFLRALINPRALE